MDFVACARCGQQTVTRAAFEKAIQRGKKPPRCRDCKTRKLIRVQYGDDYCIPHQLLFDKNDYPVDKNGNRIYSTEPTCGHRDCVKPSHHVTDALVTFTVETHSRIKKLGV